MDTKSVTVAASCSDSRHIGMDASDEEENVGSSQTVIISEGCNAKQSFVVKSSSVACSICGNTYSNAANARRHSDSVHGKSAVREGKVSLEENKESMNNLIGLTECRRRSTAVARWSPSDHEAESPRKKRKRAESELSPEQPARNESKANKCQRCGTECSRKSYKFHIKRCQFNPTEAGNPHVCRFCFRRFATLAGLETHFAKQHSARRCEKCNQSYWPSKVAFHICQESKTKLVLDGPVAFGNVNAKHDSFTCIVCQTKFENTAQLRFHFFNVSVGHGLDDLCTCPTCHRSIMIRNISRHVIQCGIKNIALRKELRKPDPVHSANRRPKSVAAPVATPKPQSTHKKVTPRSVGNTVENESFQCKKCGKFLPSHFALLGHTTARHGKAKSCFRCGWEMLPHLLALHLPKCKGSGAQKQSPKISPRRPSRSTKEIQSWTPDPTYPVAKQGTKTSPGLPMGKIKPEPDSAYEVSARSIKRHGRKSNRSGHVHSEEFIDETYKCIVCGEQFGSLVALHVHLFEQKKRSDHSIDSIVNCQNCKRSISLKFLSRHLFHCPAKLVNLSASKVSQHPTSPGINCHKCGAACRSSKGLRIHNLRYHHPSKTYCWECYKLFKKEDFANHGCQKGLSSQKGKPSERFSCSACRVKFASFGSLRAHRALSRCQASSKRSKKGASKKEPSTISSADDRVFCKICNSQFAHRSSLGIHNWKLHTPGKVYCNKCYHRFDEAEYSNHQCEDQKGSRRKKRKNKSKVKVAKPIAASPPQKNEMSDGSAWKFSCSKCAKSYTNMGALKIHVYRKHRHRESKTAQTPSTPAASSSKSPFICSTCGASFAIQTSLIGHINIRHKTRACKLCSKVFRLNIFGRHLKACCVEHGRSIEQVDPAVAKKMKIKAAEKAAKIAAKAGY